MKFEITVHGLPIIREQHARDEAILGVERTYFITEEADTVTEALKAAIISFERAAEADFPYVDGSARLESM